ncbi:proprotein convertase P-domain-containing protein [Actinokineospora sp.]|uniref:proprotein convertase P-domain-containing protein n=1 Tax=Actinokineospora sp. TaxID=1872133 RepID=UPI0040383543
MRLRSRVVSAVCGTALAATALAVTVHSGVSQAAPASADEPGAPVAAVRGLARDLGISAEQARTRLHQQDRAHRVLKTLPAALSGAVAGKWFDDRTGKLTLAVTSQADAERARAAGAEATLVSRGPAELDRLLAAVRALAGSGVAGLNTFGVDQRGNDILITVNRSTKDASTERFVAAANALGGVRVQESDRSPRQQAGDVRPGSPWWPGGETNCSIGFSATDANGAKQMLTAGHCTNDANQAAYGGSGQQNRLGTSNVGGAHSVNAREGDMGVVAVTESGWNLSASVNTWGGPPVTVTGSAEALVGEDVCHSGNTSKWQCGKVTYVNETVNYGGGLVVEGLTFTTACSKGGDSGGAWLRGDKAVGLHEGGPAQCVTNPGKDDQSIFQPVNEALRKWNLTLFTGGGGDTEAPTVPAAPRSTGQTDTTVALAWDAATDNVGVTGYEVYAGATLATTVAGTSATVSGLTPDTAYSFTVLAKDAAGNRSAPSAAVSARTKPGDTGGRIFSNSTDFPIRDFQVAVSPIRTTATGAAANPVRVSVTASHTCLQDLQITVVGPSGRRYTLQNYGGFVCTPFPGTKAFSFVPNTEPATGTWTLRIGDNGPGDIGVLDTWSITV